jgi:hypothetical protein
MEVGSGKWEVGRGIWEVDIGWEDKRTAPLALPEGREKGIL